jgi:hypothetical protein
MFCEGLVEGKTMTIMMDTGSERNLVGLELLQGEHPDVARSLRQRMQPTMVKVRGAGGQLSICPGEVEVKYEIGGSQFIAQALVLPGCQWPMVLGLPTMRDM